MNEISIYLPGILLAYAAFLLAIASPGPNVLAVIGTSMSVGRRSGVALTMGVAVGSLSWGILTAAGPSAVLALYSWSLVVIKIAGGSYLLWLGYKSLRAAAIVHDIAATTLAGAPRSPRGFFMRGFTVQMTNPKALLAWIAIMSLGLHEDAPLWVALVIVAGTFALSAALHYLYAVAFSTNVMVRLYSKARRWIQGALGVFFAFAGIKLVTSRL